MIVKLLREHGECLGNRRSLRFPSWQFSALQNRHLLICLGEDKYLLMLPGFVLIYLNSAQRHHLKLTARALLTQPWVLNLSARCDWRPASLHTASWTPKSFRVREPRDKCHTLHKDERRGCPRRWWGGSHGPVTVQGHWGEELNMIKPHCTEQHLPKTWVWITQELLFQ